MSAPATTANSAPEASLLSGQHGPTVPATHDSEADHTACYLLASSNNSGAEMLPRLERLYFIYEKVKF